MIIFKKRILISLTYGGDFMENRQCEVNECIKCTVDQCIHHCDEVDYCSLPSILVGTHDSNPKMEQSTDCMSFDARNLE
ncbi:MAG: hypothetical protein K0R15_2499 [Clostridiales bacterium]|jgi:hypothetical protein|nr:hypothetical protein [Clostridiales bacterium]